MNITEMFQVLDIDVTKDEAAIKNAYRTKLAVTNPEDNPEGFKRLRTAYEEACEYARINEEELQEKEDTTPSGLWVSKAAEIYKNMDSRRDLTAWEALFEDDTFMNLEEEENCVLKFLRFMLDNFRFSTPVWKLLDEKLGICANQAVFRENFPSDFVNYIMNKSRNGEDLDFDLFEGAPDAEYDLFIQYCNQCCEAIQDDRLEQAEEFIQNAKDLEIFHPFMELNHAWLWEKQGRIKEAVEHANELWKRYREDVTLGYNAAELLWRNGYKEQAVEIYESIKAKMDTHYMANVRLMQWFYEQSDYKEAKKYAGVVLRLGGDDEFRDLLKKINEELKKELQKKIEESNDPLAAIELCWCHLQDDDIAVGLDLALRIEGSVPAQKEAEYQGLMAKLYLESADYKEAIEKAKVWEQTLYEKIKSEDADSEEYEKDKDRVRQSYLIRARAYRKLGYKDKEYFSKAIETLRKVIEELAEENQPELNAMLEMAVVYMDMEEYEKSLELCRTLIEEYQIVAAYATMQKVYSYMWDAKGVLDSGYICIRQYPNYAQAYEKIAKVYLDYEHMEDLQSILDAAREAGIKSVLLDAYEYRMSHEKLSTDEVDEGLEKFRKAYLEPVEKGDFAYYEKGLHIINEYLYSYPGAYLLTERGLFHRAAGKYEEAEADFNKALTMEPGNAYAYNALAYMYRLQKRYEEAILCKKEAILYFEEEYVGSYDELSTLYSLIGLHNKAAEIYENVLRIGGEEIKKSKYYMHRYALFLGRAGRTEEAVAVLRIAFADGLDMYNEMVEIYRDSDMEEKALEILKEWGEQILKRPNVSAQDWAEYYDSMAWQELLYGEGKKAISYFEKVRKVLSKEADPDGYGYADTIFTCILYGEDEKGAKFAKELKKFNDERTNYFYYEADKFRLHKQFVCSYYTASEEELKALLEKEKDTCICSFCTYGLCKELEAMRILFLLRVGRRDEALARLEDILKKQPFDEFMRAIKNRLKNKKELV